MLARRDDGLALGDNVACHASIRLLKKGHRRVHARELRPPRAARASITDRDGRKSTEYRYG